MFNLKTKEEGFIYLFEDEDVQGILIYKTPQGTYMLETLDKTYELESLSHIPNKITEININTWESRVVFEN